MSMRGFSSVGLVRPKNNQNVDDAIELPRFSHPERAFYIFGPEDGTLGRQILDRCKYRAMVPTAFCMNLAATVNVVLYDRMSKRGERLARAA